MGSIWGRQDPGGPHVGPMNFAIWLNIQLRKIYDFDINMAAKHSSFFLVSLKATHNHAGHIW